MLAHYETRIHNNETKIWTGRYKSLSNLPHWHHDCEIINVECGSAEVFIDGKRYSMKQGESAFIDSGDIHFIHAEPQSILSFITYDFKITERITNKEKLVSPIVTNESFGKLYENITNEIKLKRPFYDLMLKQILISEIISIFRENPTETKSPSITETSQRYKELLAEIDEKYAFFTYKDAASFVGFCQPYFSTYFKTMSGMTFTQYINRVRVEKAVEILRHEPDLPITEISNRCGFDTIRNFNRVFKSITGYTPKELPADISFSDFQQSKVTDGFNPTQKESILLND